MFVLKISQAQFTILDFYVDFVSSNLTGSFLSFRVVRNIKGFVSWGFWIDHVNYKYWVYCGKTLGYNDTTVPPMWCKENILEKE